MLTELQGQRTARRIALWSIVIASLALFTGLVSLWRSSHSQSSSIGTGASSAMRRIRATGVLRVGYGGFPPYTIVDPKERDPSKRVKGVVVDMINNIAARQSPPLKVEWSNLNWETFRADMLSGHFDFLADAVYATVPKAIDFGITEPFSYFGIAAAVVRNDEDRFREFSDLDRTGITIALANGYVSTDFAREHLQKPHLKLMVVGEDAFTQMDEVLNGRADVALNDVPTVVQYVRAHPGRVKALWVDSPPSWVAAGFVTRGEDLELLTFLNTCIRILKTDGTLAEIDRKWRSLGYFEKPTLIPGAGLRDIP